MTIKILDFAGGFAEDKSAARSVRLSDILPALRLHQTVTLDFTGVRLATQSFVHALISEPLHEFDENVLDHLIFKGCTEEVKTIIEIVITYSLNPPVHEESVHA